MRIPRFNLTLILLTLATTNTVAPAETPKQRPNILFIFSDDQAYDTIRGLGNQEIETPNLDRLITQGTTFTHAYNMGSWAGAVCVASRTMLISGQSLWHSGIHSDGSGYTADGGTAQKKKNENSPGVSHMGKILSTYVPKKTTDFRPWPQLLPNAGYSTFFAGKWHVSFEASIFEQTGTVRKGMPEKGYWQGGTHWSEVLANETIDFLKDEKRGEKPFFMYVAFNAPHDPRQSPPEFIEKYPKEKLSIPQPFLPEYPFAQEICGKLLRDERIAPYPRTKEVIQRHRQEYYALVTHMDREIGRILDALQQSGEAENTLIIFSSDNGLACGRHGLMGKQNMFEHSLRVPLIFAGPGIPKGKTIDTRVYYQDIVPTILDLAGMKIPEFVDFHSLLPLIRGETDKANNPAIYAAYFDTQRAVISGNYKLIVYPYAAQKILLYDLSKDPGETQDLASQPEFNDIVRKLASDLQKLQKEMHDPMDISALIQTR